MPEGKRSPLTEDVIAIVDAMMGDYDILVEELAPIPFMQEEISRQEYQRRFRAMTPQQRLEEMQRIGTGEVLRLMGGA